MNTPRVLPYGLLPTPSMLHPRAVAAGVGTASLLAVMRESLRRHGPNDGLLQVLRALGFTWAEPSVSDLDLDVAAVADALSSASPVADPPHSAAKSAAPSGDTTTTGDAGGVW